MGSKDEREGKQMNLPKRGRRKHERMNDAKALREDLENFDFTSSLAKAEMRKEAGKRRTR